MSPSRQPVAWETVSALRGVLLTRRAGAEAVLERQQRRYHQMFAYARSRSPFYRDLYRQLPDGPVSLLQLPVVTKPQLMGRFDEVVTDRSIRRRDIDQFLSDPHNIGRPFLGKYQVATSSGTTGEPGVFVLDHLALLLRAAIPRARDGLGGGRALWHLAQFLLSGRRSAVVAIGSGPYGAFTAYEWLRRQHPRLARGARFISVLDPIELQVQELNDLQPQVMGGYPSALLLLAREKAAGRLRGAPYFIVLAGENITASGRRFIETAFGCPTYEVYASTENGAMAVQCREGRLHANIDWFVLEPVDSHYQPVGLGTRSHTLLVTNLTNRVMPLIRYDQGDSVLVREERCPCGSALPVMEVTGRTDDLLELAARDGRGTVTLSPAGLATVIEETRGVYRAQVVQRSAADIEVRLQPLPGTPAQDTWDAVVARAREYLGSQGVGTVALHLSAAAPMQHPRSGKYAQVVRRM